LYLLGIVILVISGRGGDRPPPSPLAEERKDLRAHGHACVRNVIVMQGVAPGLGADEVLVC
jgi:hypothetical protein